MVHYGEWCCSKNFIITIGIITEDALALHLILTSVDGECIIF